MQPSIRLADRRGRSYWIARDTQRLGELHAIALAAGGPDHPLVRVLRTPMHAL